MLRLIWYSLSNTMSPIRLGKLKDIKILIICTHLAWSSCLYKVKLMILVHSISKKRHYIVNLFIVYSSLSCFSPIQWNLSNRTLSKIDFLSNSGRISKSQNFAIILSVINYFINWMSIPNSGLHLRPQYTNFIYNYPVQTHYVTDILNSYSSLCAHITDLNTSIMMMTMIPIMKVKLTTVATTFHIWHIYETMSQFLDGQGWSLHEL